MSPGEISFYLITKGLKRCEDIEYRIQLGDRENRAAATFPRYIKWYTFQRSHGTIVHATASDPESPAVESDIEESALPSSDDQIDSSLDDGYALDDKVSAASDNREDEGDDNYESILNSSIDRTNSGEESGIYSSSDEELNDEELSNTSSSDEKYDSTDEESSSYTDSDSGVSCIPDSDSDTDSGWSAPTICTVYLPTYPCDQRYMAERPDAELIVICAGAQIHMIAQ